MPPKILIVEDDDSIQHLYNELFSDYELYVCSDGLEGLTQYLEHDTWDLIIMDMFLPSLTGEKCIEVIRKAEEDAVTPIIVISGKLNKDLLEKLALFDKLAIIPKPFENDQLLEKVEQLLAEK